MTVATANADDVVIAPSVQCRLAGMRGPFLDYARGVLAARGLQVDWVEPHAPAFEAVAMMGAAIGWYLPVVDELALATRWAALCAATAALARPVVVFTPAIEAGEASAVLTRAALHAYLEAHGAVLVSDPDVWLECLVFLANYRLPQGSRTALIAPPDSFLAEQAACVSREAEKSASRVLWPRVSGRPDGPTHLCMYDASVAPPAQGELGSVFIPVAPRGELPISQTGVLIGARAAVLACAHLGAAADRIAAGLGAASTRTPDDIDVDLEKVTRQLTRVDEFERRLGDHETKALLSAFGVTITRQAVATTASAALRIAKRAGFPVEMKPWGPDVPAENAGCPVERNVQTGADVRRAFAAVLQAAGRSFDEAEGAAVIVREQAPSGRAISAAFVQLGPLGWTAVVYGTGKGVPATAPAPLRPIDAQRLASQLLASRSDETPPDRAALADILRRASYVVTAPSLVNVPTRFARIELASVVVGALGERTVVVDAFVELS